jgi:hypothetical protein
MQGIILLVFTGALLYLGRKAIQYVRHRMVDPVILNTTGTIPGNAPSFHQTAL